MAVGGAAWRDDVRRCGALWSDEPRTPSIDGPAARISDTREVEIIPRLIEGEIIPQLVQAHRRAVNRSLARAAGDVAATAGPSVHPGAAPSADDVERLTRIVVERDETAAIAFVDTVCARGVALEDIFLDLLAPAARRLGDGWCADTHAFIDVTIGLSRLQQVMRTFSREFQLQGAADDGAPLDAPDSRQILLAPTVGEQHNFGILMVAEFLIRAGWGVSCAAGSSAGELVRAVRRDRFAVLGLSLSSDRFADDLRDIVSAVRRSARNPEIAILVGGRAFIEDPDLVRRVGAHAMAADGLDAVAQAEALCPGPEVQRERLSMVC